MAFTKKIAGWVAGRIKGEKARKDTMRWMEKTGLGMILDAAGDYALAQGAIKGAGALKGLLTGGGQAAAPVAAKALPEGVTEVGRMASASPAEARFLTAQMVQPKPMPVAGAGTTTVAPRAATAITPPPAPPSAMTAPTATRIVATPTAPSPMQAMVAPGAGAGPVTPRIGMPQMPTSLPPAGGAAPTPIASQVSAGMRPPTPPTPAPTFAATPRPTLPPAPSPMQAMTAPAAAPAPAPMGGMTPPMRATAQRMGGIENVANANITRGAGGFRGFMQGAKEYAPLIQATAGPVANVIGAKIEQDIEQQKLDREQRARNNLAMLLMPMFQAQMGQAAPSFQPRG